MKEYIEREILQKAINTEIGEHAEDAKESLYERGYNNGLMMAYALLLKTLAADVAEVRHGRVMVHDGHEDEYFEYCSECGTTDIRSGDNYCPNCGAKMDKEE